MQDSGERRGRGGNGTARTPEPGEPGAAQPAPTGAAAGPAMPLFYKDPRPLAVATHAGKGVRRPRDYRFAAAAHAVVLQAQEFRLAAAHYPIVFAAETPALPLALLGYRQGENLFVDAEGCWAPETYVPAYVRRYPFATAQAATPGEAVLCVDMASDLVVDLAAQPEAEPFFTDGAPSEATKQALGLCAAVQQQAVATQAFAEALGAHGLLEAKEVRLELPGGGEQLLTGLRLIDEGRFNALSDEVFLEWRRKAWLPLVYWHWASMDNFRRMVRRG